MNQPNRKDTLKFTFDRTFVRPNSYEFERFLEEVVKITSDELVGIHFSIVSTVIYVKLITADLCERIIHSSGGSFKFKHSDGNISEVTVTHAGFGIRTVRIFELPFEVTAEQINDVVSSYGTVLSNIAERWSGAHKFPVFNGIRQLKVDLRRHIPSYIDVCGYRAIVMYEGQPKTCAGCGATGHVRAQCMQRRIAQLPVGESVRPSTMSSLPITYVAAVAGPPPTAPILNTSQDNIPTANDGTMEVTEAAAPVTGERQPTEPSNAAPIDAAQGVILMEVNDAAVAVPVAPHPTELSEKPFSERVQASLSKTDGPSADDSFTDPEQENATDESASSPKSRSPRKKKKRRIAHQAAEEIVPLMREKIKQVVQKLQESPGEVSADTQPKPLPKETGRSPPTPVAAKQTTSVAPLNIAAEIPCDTGLTTSASPFQKNWADEVAADEEMREPPTPLTAALPVSSDEQTAFPNQAMETGYESDTY